jgi:hypothetical protein
MGGGVGKTIRLYHGTCAPSAQHLLTHGLDEVTAKHYNGGGEFWATPDPMIADWFAHANPASPPAARFEFDLPEAVLNQLLGQALPAVLEHRTSYLAYEFKPQGFATVNPRMAHQTVVPLP